MFITFIILIKFVNHSILKKYFKKIKGKVKIIRRGAKKNGKGEGGGGGGERGKKFKFVLD